MSRKREIINLDEFDLPESKLKPSKKEEFVLAKQKQIFETAVSIGKCSDCDLRTICQYKNDTDTVCRATNAAIDYFEKQAFKLPHIQPTDKIGIRSLASIY